MEKTVENTSMTDIPPYIIVYERPGDNKVNIENLTITTPDGRVLVDNVNAEIPVGSRVAIIGENGTGKTTTAKALTGNFDYGSGKVGVPSTMKDDSMIMSQEAFLPDVSLRAILNKTPDENPVFKDEELANALRMVHHERLIQHIPGQQTSLLVDDLLKIAQSSAAKTDAEIKATILEKIPELVAEQFEVVQFMTEKPKQKLRDGLSEIKGVSNPDQMAKDITHAIDSALLGPLKKRMDIIIEHEAFAKRGKLFSYTPGRASYFAGVFASGLKDQLKEYMANKDTDNKLRPIHINNDQKNEIVHYAYPKMKEAFKRNANPSVLGKIFHMATSPLSYLFGMRLKAGHAAKNTKNAISFFMDTQVVKGSELKRRLSGGEKQRLIFAKALLHKPKLLIADEPTAALDEHTGEEMYKLLMDTMPEDSTIISIVHDLEKINHHDTLGEIADQAVTLSKVDENTVHDLRQKIIERHTRELESGNMLTAEL